jgi:flagellin-specific chaperone FliS
MANDAEKMLFRMQHIIPQQLSSVLNVHDKETVSSNVNPMEIEFQMTWGKVAGT